MPLGRLGGEAQALNRVGIVLGRRCMTEKLHLERRISVQASAPELV
jgi:hypothetical protein